MTFDPRLAHFFQPNTIQEALSLKLENHNLVPLAGGTDLMVQHTDSSDRKSFLDLSKLTEIKTIQFADNRWRIGAGATYSDLLANKTLCTSYPLLAQAALATGVVAIQNRGTLGGNIMNASPAADTPPALLVYDAEVELSSSEGIRRLALKDFYLSYRKTAAKPSELLTAIYLPKHTLSHTHYEKVGTRAAQAISKVVFAGGLELKENKIIKARFAFGSMLPTSARAFKAEAALENQVLTKESIKSAIQALKRDLNPIDDIRSTKNYRLQVAYNLVESWLSGLLVILTRKN